MDQMFGKSWDSDSTWGTVRKWQPHIKLSSSARMYLFPI
jgi:hypothetical protein